MNFLVKKLLTQVGSFSIGVGMIAANGAFMLNKSETNVTHVSPLSATGVTDTANINTEVGYAEGNAVLTINAAELSASEYSKATLDNYDMLLKSDDASDESATKAENDGNVSAYELDSTTIYDPQYEPLNFTQTRDTSSEYYTVYDIISGSTMTLDAHELICRMVYSEIGASWGEEAIKAQAVAAYSYIRFNDNLGLTPTVGLKSGYPTKIESCVSAVEGQAVFYSGEIINAVYSASTAGYSVESERIWDVYYPYLRAVVSEYDYEDPNYGLEYSFTTEEVSSALEKTCSITLSDDIDNWLTVEDVYSGMYVGYINVDGQVTITCRTFKELFGLKSQAITIERTDSGFLFKSYGWGHGVGMSQWGACYYAQHGYTYDQILRHYYLNTTIGLSTESSKAVERGKTSTSSTSDETTSSQAQTASTTTAETTTTTTTTVTTTAPSESVLETESSVSQGGSNESVGDTYVSDSSASDTSSDSYTDDSYTDTDSDSYSDTSSQQIEIDEYASAYSDESETE